MSVGLDWTATDSVLLVGDFCLGGAEPSDWSYASYWQRMARV